MLPDMTTNNSAPDDKSIEEDCLFLSALNDLNYRDDLLKILYGKENK